MEWTRYSTPSPVRPGMLHSPRNEEEIDEISQRLKALCMFCSLPWDVLSDIASNAQLVILPSRTLVFSQGESGVYWYIVLSGSLDVMVAASRDEAKVISVCTLAAGATVGESVLFGGQRMCSVETLEPSQLLVIPACKLKALCEKHPLLMEGPVPSFEKKESPPSVTDSDVEDVDSSLALSRRASGRYGSAFQNVRDTQLVLMGFVLYQLIKDNFPTLLSNRTFHLRTYPDSCSGKDLVDWVLLNSSVERSRNMVVGMWQALLDAGVLAHTVSNQQQFVDSTVLYYHFTVSADSSPGDTPPSRSPATLRCSLPNTLSSGSSRRRSAHSMASVHSLSGSTASSDSLDTQLDECFDVLEQCAPESLTFAAFMKKPEERSEQDIRIIFEELMHVKAFAQLSHAVKRELAACIVFDCYKGMSGHVLFKQGDVGTSWYIILKGSVSVIVQGKGVVCTLHEGDDFGKLALVNDAPRAASIQLREDHCSFLCVDKNDFNRILRSVEANTVRLQEYGRDVLVLEKEGGEKYSVVSGTPEKMIEHLMDIAAKDDDSDPFFYEFFLTHPVFISLDHLCSILKATYSGSYQYSQENVTQIVVVLDDGSDEEDVDAGKGEDSSTDATKRKVVKLVVKWIKVMGQSLVTEPAFNKLFQELTTMLVKDGQTAALDSLNQAFVQGYLSKSAATDTLRKNRTNTLFRKTSASSSSGIGPSTAGMPAALPTDEVPLVVHTKDGRSCHFSVQLQSTASEILSIACNELNMSPSTSDLCEVTVMGEQSVIKPSRVSVSSGLALNSQLFVLPKGHSEKLDVSTVQQSFPLPEEEGVVEREAARDLALHLTLLDWQLLSNISRSEYVYHVFGQHKFGKITTNLDRFLYRFNEVQFWVVTEVCRIENLQTRVKVVCKFIKMAGHCKKHNNLSSFFAIVFGLMNIAVSRLRSTWERVPANLKRKLEGFEALADPSRNHRALRMYQNNLKSPVIPFLPLVMKDAAFIHEGNETLVQDELVNFEKMRMLASRVHGVEQLMAGSLHESVTAVAQKTPHIREYLTHLKVVNNTRLLSQQSKKIE